METLHLVKAAPLESIHGNWPWAATFETELGPQRKDLAAKGKENNQSTSPPLTTTVQDVEKSNTFKVDSRRIEISTSPGIDQEVCNSSTTEWSEEQPQQILLTPEYESQG